MRATDAFAASLSDATAWSLSQVAVTMVPNALVYATEAAIIQKNRWNEWQEHQHNFCL